ncbi:MAG: hypothetical protein Q4E35_03550 [Eubacteriales bacterium]|nr:hypothetical protein [Eubacteriales bacterium]
MIENIKKKLLSFREELEKVPERQHIPRGRTHNVIVIKPKNDIFIQVIFIMRDDYFSSSALPQEELLQRARQAAGVYVPPLSGLSRKCTFIIAALSVLLAAETAILLFYIF